MDLCRPSFSLFLLLVLLSLSRTIDSNGVSIVDNEETSKGFSRSSGQGQKVVPSAAFESNQASTAGIQTTVSRRLLAAKKANKANSKKKSKTEDSALGTKKQNVSSKGGTGKGQTKPVAEKKTAVGVPVIAENGGKVPNKLPDSKTVLPLMAQNTSGASPVEAELILDKKNLTEQLVPEIGNKSAITTESAGNKSDIAVANGTVVDAVKKVAGVDVADKLVAIADSAPVSNNSTETQGRTSLDKGDTVGKGIAIPDGKKLTVVAGNVTAVAGEKNVTIVAGNVPAPSSGGNITDGIRTDLLAGGKIGAGELSDDSDLKALSNVTWDIESNSNVSITNGRQAGEAQGGNSTETNTENRTENGNAGDKSLTVRPPPSVENISGSKKSVEVKITTKDEVHSENDSQGRSEQGQEEDIKEDLKSTEGDSVNGFGENVADMEIKTDSVVELSENELHSKKVLIDREKFPESRGDPLEIKATEQIANEEELKGQHGILEGSMDNENVKDNDTEKENGNENKNEDVDPDEHNGETEDRVEDTKGIQVSEKQTVLGGLESKGRQKIDMDDSLVFGGKRVGITGSGTKDTKDNDDKSQVSTARQETGNGEGEGEEEEGDGKGTASQKSGDSVQEDGEENPASGGTKIGNVRKVDVVENEANTFDDMGMERKKRMGQTISSRWENRQSDEDDDNDDNNLDGWKGRRENVKDTEGRSESNFLDKNASWKSRDTQGAGQKQVVQDEEEVNSKLDVDTVKVGSDASLTEDKLNGKRLIGSNSEEKTKLGGSSGDGVSVERTSLEGEPDKRLKTISSKRGSDSWKTDDIGGDGSGREKGWGEDVDRLGRKQSNVEEGISRRRDSRSRTGSWKGDDTDAGQVGRGRGVVKSRRSGVKTFSDNVNGDDRWEGNAGAMSRGKGKNTAWSREQTGNYRGDDDDQSQLGLVNLKTTRSRSRASNSRVASFLNADDGESYRGTGLKKKSRSRSYAADIDGEDVEGVHVEDERLVNGRRKRTRSRIVGDYQAGSTGKGDERGRYEVLERRKGGYSQGMGRNADRLTRSSTKLFKDGQSERYEDEDDEGQEVGSRWVTARKSSRGAGKNTYEEERENDGLETGTRKRRKRQGKLYDGEYDTETETERNSWGRAGNDREEESGAYKSRDRLRYRKRKQGTGVDGTWEVDDDEINTKLRRRGAVGGRGNADLDVSETRTSDRLGDGLTKDGLYREERVGSWRRSRTRRKRTGDLPDTDTDEGILEGKAGDGDTESIRGGKARVDSKIIGGSSKRNADSIVHIHSKKGVTNKDGKKFGGATGKSDKYQVEDEGDKWDFETGADFSGTAKVKSKDNISGQIDDVEDETSFDGDTGRREKDNEEGDEGEKRDDETEIGFRSTSKVKPKNDLSGQMDDVGDEESVDGGAVSRESVYKVVDEEKNQMEDNNEMEDGEEKLIHNSRSIDGSFKSKSKRDSSDGDEDTNIGGDFGKDKGEGDISEGDDQQGDDVTGRNSRGTSRVKGHLSGQKKAEGEDEEGGDTEGLSALGLEEVEENDETSTNLGALKTDTSIKASEDNEEEEGISALTDSGTELSASRIDTSVKSTLGRLNTNEENEDEEPNLSSSRTDTTMKSRFGNLKATEDNGDEEGTSALDLDNFSENTNSAITDIDREEGEDETVKRLGTKYGVDRNEGEDETAKRLGTKYGVDRNEGEDDMVKNMSTTSQGILNRFKNVEDVATKDDEEEDIEDSGVTEVDKSGNQLDRSWTSNSNTENFYRHGRINGAIGNKENETELGGYKFGYGVQKFNTTRSNETNVGEVDYMKKSGERGGASMADLLEEDEPLDFFSELVLIGRNFFATMRGVQNKTQTHFTPRLKKMAATGQQAFTSTSASLETRFVPYLGLTYSPLFATVISYSLLLGTLALAIAACMRMRSLLTLRSVLLFFNLYLSLYFFSLLMTCLIISGEPMAALQQAAEVNFLVLQLVQAMGYTSYLLLQVVIVVLTFQNEALGTVDKWSPAGHLSAASAIGLHYYVMVFQRAMVDQRPHITWAAYLVYALTFGVMYQLIRVKRSKLDAIREGEEVPKEL